MTHIDHKPQAAKVRMQLMCLCNIVFCSAKCLHSHDTVAHALRKASLPLQRAMDLHLRVPPERWGLTRCEFHAFVQEALETPNQRQQCAIPCLFWGGRRFKNGTKVPVRGMLGVGCRLIAPVRYIASHIETS